MIKFATGYVPYKSKKASEMELFIIPRKVKSEEGYLIYAPLQNLAFATNSVGAKIVEKYIDGEDLSDVEKESVIISYIKQIENTHTNIPLCKDIDIENSAVIILSEMCNLACTYCYAQETRSKTILSKNIVKKAIDAVFVKNTGKKSFVFIGGGEPLITWDLLEWALNYIHNKGKKCNNDVEIIITTNATLLTDEKINILRDKNIHLGISFDILPSIQNAQRIYPHSEYGTFGKVNTAIHKLDEAKIEYSIRSTITKEHVSKMVDMVRFVIDNYKNVRKLHFEPVASRDDNDEKFYDDFVSSFMEARKLGQRYNIVVHNSMSDSVDKIRARFCRGEFCVSPTGEIIACHRFSSEKDSNFAYVNYGLIDEDIHIDREKKSQVFSLFNYKRAECASCFAKWHCAGGCVAERLVQTSSQNEAKCRYNKALILELLEERIQQ